MKKDKINLTPSADDYGEPPLDCDDMINRYGTYNIQSTANTDNAFPKIAQGSAAKGKSHKNNRQR